MKRLKMNKQKLTFKDGCEMYIQDCKARNLRERTIHYLSSYKQMYNYFSPDMPLDEFTPAVFNGYDKVNGKWRSVVYKLVNIDNPIAQEVLKELLKAADDNVGDIISSDGIAANGLIKFFLSIYNWILKIINWIKSIFVRR